MQNFRLRVRYAKRPQVAYLSHLETMRTFMRMLARSGLPVALTQGFSPHIKVSFGFALPVGTAAEQESLDVELTSYVAPAQALACLQAAQAPGFPVSACRYVSPKYKALTVSHCCFEYRVELERALPPEALSALMAQGQLSVEKPKGTKTFIFAECFWQEPGLEGSILNLYIQANPNGQLRPEYFVAALEGAKSVAITRTRAFARP
jgi:radical SAM-linked protein